MRWIIRVSDGRHSSRPVRFEVSRTVKLGRASPAEIVIDDPKISNEHAILEPRGDGIHVTDLGSSNGTFLNGHRIQSGIWLPGRKLAVGNVELALVPAGSRDPVQTTSPKAARSRWPGFLNWLWSSDGQTIHVPAPRYRLVWESAGDKSAKSGQRHLPPRTDLIIGSHIECDVVLDDPVVSRKHAQLSVRDGVVRVSDLGSSNGCRIDGRRIDKAVLSNGQTLTIGPFALSVQAASGDSMMMRAIDTIVQPANKFEKSVSGLKEQQKVFISYARQDMAFADRIAASLIDKGFHVSIDRRDLPFGQEWQQELAALVRNCDTLLFLVTPRSVSRPWCKWELQLAGELQKRIFPIMVEATDMRDIPDQLRRVNFLPSMSEGAFSFRSHMPQLVMALNTDQAWTKEHSRLQSRAREWFGKGKAEALLLRGDALKVAKAWSLAAPPTQRPAAEVLELIRVSTIKQRQRIATQALLLALPAMSALAATYYFRQELGLVRILTRTDVVVKTEVVVQEVLRPYQVSFCSQLKEALRGRAIDIDGERCMLPTDITFASGQAELTGEGRHDMDGLAAVITQLAQSISSDEARTGAKIDWVLRIDGHTDKRPIANSRFPSNWELSTARATAAVRYLVDKHKIPQSRLVAAGYGPNRPLAGGEDDESLRKNRRIELRLASP